MSNLRVKADVVPQLGAPVSPEEAQAQVDKLKATLPEIDQAKKWIETSGDFNDMAEVEILEAKIKSELALLENYLATGQWETPAGAADGAAGVAGGSGATEAVRTLNPGWNGDFVPRTEPTQGYEDVAGWEAGAEFQGLIFIKDDTPEHKSEVAFQASATTTDIRAYNHGNDIVYVETYLDENGATKKRFWVGVDHATNVRSHIAIDTHNLDHGVTMDFSRTLRNNNDPDIDPATKVNGFIFVGSDFNDTISGSQGDDIIYGLKGDDKLYGLGGMDSLYGDDDPVFAAKRAALGLATDLVDGEDTIDGGEDGIGPNGGDVIDFGGGFNYGFKNDVAHKTGVHTDLASSGETLQAGALLGNQTNGFAMQDSSAGFAVIEETGTGNNILDLKIPEGYSMAYASADGTTDLKITFVKEGTPGHPPQTYVVTIKRVMGSRIDSLGSPFTLILKGNQEPNIVDFHNVDFKNNNFVAEGINADDMVMEPTTTLSQEDLTVEDLVKTNLTALEVDGKMKTVVAKTDEGDDQSWINAARNDKSEIEVTLDGAPEDGKPKTLTITPPRRL